MADQGNSLKYSRQLGQLYSTEDFQRIQALHVFLYRLDGTGVEILKNLYHLGVLHFTLCDASIVTPPDLSVNYLLSDQDIGKRMDESVKARFDQWYTPDPNCVQRVDALDDQFSQLTENKIDICIVSNVLDSTFLSKINTFCRKNNIRFIWTGSWGLQGFIFNDFGDIFTSSNPGFQKTIRGKVLAAAVSKQQSHNTFSIRVKCFEDPFAAKSYVTINHQHYLVEACSAPDEDIQQELTLTGGDSVTVNVNDAIQNVFDKSESKFSSFDDFFARTNDIEFLDAKCTGQFEHIMPENLLHQLQVIMCFIQQTGRQPATLAKADWDLCRDISEKMSQLQQWNDAQDAQMNQKWLMLACKLFQTQLSPICNMLGALASQEALKIIGKGYPINQMLLFENYSVLSDSQATAISDSDSSSKNIDMIKLDRQFSQRIIFGDQFQSALQKLKLFIVGAGALGSEYAKLVALSGACSAHKEQQAGEVAITDSDIIEQSNLNRQFLFTRQNVQNKQYKSKVLEERIKQIDSHINVKSHTLNVGGESENQFTNKFYSELDAVLLAVDNNQARQYIVNKGEVSNYLVVEAGTEKLQSNSQIYIPSLQPKLTFDTSTDQQIISCTVPGMPRKLSDNIQWSYIYFQKKMETDIQSLFDRIELTKKNPVQSTDHSISASESYRLLQLSYLQNKSVEVNNINLEKKIKAEVIKISQSTLKSIIDEISVIKQKNLSLPDVKPQLKELEIQFIYLNCHLLCNIFNLPKITPHDIDNYFADSNQMNVSNSIFDLGQITEDKIIEFYKKNDLKIQPQVFDKDSEELKHTEFIFTLSNIRAKLFDFPEEPDINKVRQIVGKITISIISTSAFICGAGYLELYKYINRMMLTKNQTPEQAKETAKSFRNYICYFRLSKDLVQFVTPKPLDPDRQASAIDYQPEKKDETLREFIHHFEEQILHSQIIRVDLPKREVSHQTCYQAEGARQNKKHLDKSVKEIYGEIKGIRNVEEHGFLHLIVEAKGQPNMGQPESKSVTFNVIYKVD